MDCIQKILFSFFFTLFIALSGCGGGGSDSSTEDDTSTTLALKGQLIDSEVAGIRFETSSFSGQTDASGYFSYAADEVITFYIGDLLIGEAAGAALVTPIDFVAGTNDPADPTVLNIVRFMLTMDDDANPDNGIQITQAVHDAAVGQSINFEQDLTTFETDTAVLVATLTSVTTAGARPLVDDATALAHLQASLLALYTGAYEGSYSHAITHKYVGTNGVQKEDKRIDK